MLAIEVEYLRGRAVASNRESRNVAEWPPHPQRLFAALVSAYHECEFRSEERAALEWLESLSPPSLVVSDAVRRDCPETYVPVNDNNKQFDWNRKQHKLKFTTAIDPGIALGRDRKERFFPTVVPEDPIVQFVWDDAEVEAVVQHRNALQQLADAVAYLGHSSSLVRVSLVDQPRSVTLRSVKTTDGLQSTNDLQLRVVTTGRLQLLEHAYHQSIELCTRREATDAPWHRYRWTKDDIQRSVNENVFGSEKNWFVFQKADGKRLPLNACLALTTSVRRAVCSVCNDPLPEILSGHRDDRSQSLQTHVAFLPLSNVGFRYSDQEIHGFAIVLPENTTDVDRRRIAHGLAEVRKIWRNLASTSDHSDSSLAFDWRVIPVNSEERKISLQPARYIRESRYWATVTPMVFGHYLRSLDEPRTFKIVAESCEAIGLPRPINIRVSPTSMINEVPQSYVFPTLSSNGKPVWVRRRNDKYFVPIRLPDGSTVRMRYHVALEFQQSVRGPLILGAGRYFGMGLCVPIPDCDLATKREVKQ